MFYGLWYVIDGIPMDSRFIRLCSWWNL